MNIGIGITPRQRLNPVLCGNFGGPRTKRDKLADVPPQKLWDIVLNRRAMDGVWGKNPVIERTLTALRETGFDDPLEITPEMRRHVTALFSRYNPQSELRKALLLFKSVIPETDSFWLDDKRFSGFSPSEGGLNIPYGKNHESSLRKGNGYLIPRKIMRAPESEKETVCLEYSFLLISLLREAGICARIKHIPRHAYVVAELGGVNYELDAAKIVFKKIDALDTVVCGDREEISIYNASKACALLEL